MIKPGTVCMIRGVPKGRLGHEFNGQVVVAKKLKTTYSDGTRIMFIDPVLVDHGGRRYTGCREQWLHPFEDFDHDLGQEALDELLTRTFLQALEAELNKI